jgi:competence protein ComEC
MPDTYKIVTSLYAETFKTIDQSGKGKSKNNTILMGSYVKLIGEQSGDWEKVTAFGIDGWIANSAIGDSPGFKCFYIDVGQGDAALIEVGNDENGMKMLIDGGPSDNLGRYLNKWQYTYYLNKGIKVHFDYVFISHFDKDHYKGLVDIINDEHYTFGTIYHNGIAKFNRDKETCPKEYNTGLGKKVKEDKEYYLTTCFDSIDDLAALKDKGGMQDLQETFLSAVQNARSQGRLQDFKRADYQTTLPVKKINGRQLKIQVLAPVRSATISSGPAFKYFEDESHTINGHSLVLKFKYGKKSFLFGGDLNIPAEEHLLAHYQGENVFKVDVAKSCHHGASEFTTEFMKQVNPFATVISSGDNESYSHPRADAIGCAGKYARSDRPLVFSTELARSTNVKTDAVKYGMINMRCDGDTMIMAQMKEAYANGDVWDLYEIF